MLIWHAFKYSEYAVKILLNFSGGHGTRCMSGKSMPINSQEKTIAQDDQGYINLL